MWKHHCKDNGNLLKMIKCNEYAYFISQVAIVVGPTRYKFSSESLKL